MTSDENQAALWKALLAAVDELTRLQPDAYEWGPPGAKRWSTPHGSDRSPAIYGDDGSVSVVFELGQPDGSDKVFWLSARVVGGGGS